MSGNGNSANGPPPSNSASSPESAQPLPTVQAGLRCPCGSHPPAQMFRHTNASDSMEYFLCYQELDTPVPNVPEGTSASTFVSPTTATMRTHCDVKAYRCTQAGIVCAICQLAIMEGFFMFVHPEKPKWNRLKYCHAQCYNAPRPPMTARRESRCPRCHQDINVNAPIEPFGASKNLWAHVGCAVATPKRNPSSSLTALDKRRLASSALITSDGEIDHTLSFMSQRSDSAESVAQRRRLQETPPYPAPPPRSATTVASANPSETAAATGAMSDRGPSETAAATGAMSDRTPSDVELAFARALLGPRATVGTSDGVTAGNEDNGEATGDDEQDEEEG